MVRRPLCGESASVKGLRPVHRTPVQLAAAARVPRRFGAVGERTRTPTALLDATEWRFASAEEAHRVTHLQHEGELGERLSGPPAGRQIWWNAADFPAVPLSAESVAPSRERFAFDVRLNPNSSDLPLRSAASAPDEERDSVPTRSLTHEARSSALRAASFYASIQCDDGHWAGDYGGPLFLMPGLVISAYISGALDVVIGAVGSEKRAAAVLYLRHHQQADGGWGTHIESPSTMFGTVLNYVALRLLRVDATACSSSIPDMLLARAFMDAHGGALHTSSWAKLWLAVLGVYEWDGIAPIPPELWLLPTSFPMHPSRFWCHCRMVYLPMSYLYGTRFVYPDAESDPLIAALRLELYASFEYAAIPWANHLSSVATIDDYSPVSGAMRTMQAALGFYEKWGGLPGWGHACPSLSFRARGCEFAREYMAAEDECTNYICIGPVNKAMNMLCEWAATNVAATAGRSSRSDRRGVWSVAFKKHLLRCDDYLWLAEDGLKMQGYNGSQTWDTTFAMQAMVTALSARASAAVVASSDEKSTSDGEEDVVRAVIDSLKSAREFVLRTQITGGSKWEREPLRSKWFRIISRGGWPFSTAAHGWPISDCTAEGLKSLIESARVLSEEGDESSESFASMSERINAAVDVLLALHNSGEGGWATYEKTRGWSWFELFNPSEVFGDIMIDYCYVECTSASVTALARVLALRCDPTSYRAAEMRAAVEQGKAFILSAQREDGSWYGSWGCCFTYAAWFAIEGLLASTGPRDRNYVEDKAIVVAVSRACEFLIAHQNESDGGWGEGFGSCHSKVYDDAPSTAVATSWALLALMASAHCPGSQSGDDDDDTRISESIERGVSFLLSIQQRNGDFAQPRNISGVFNRSCGITYTSYRNVFPIWALAKFAEQSSTASTRTEKATIENGSSRGVVDEKPSPTIDYLWYAAAAGAAFVVLPVLIVLLALVSTGVGAGTIEHPLGLLCGIASVGIAQLCLTLPYYWWLMNMSSQPLIQLPHAERGRAQGAMYAFYGVSRHFAQPEGFLLIGGYLTVTWLFKMLPSSYYVLEAPTLDGTRFVNVLAQVSACLCGTQVLLLLITNSPILPPSTLIFRCFPAFASWQLLAVDFLQWGAHRLEHVIKPLYMRAHVPHHKWRSPSLFEAFEGSMTDTIVMIVIPLFLSAHGIAFLSKFMLPFVIAPTAVDYMIFGTIYANFLCLIHSPRVHPWEDTRTLLGRLVRALGIGTAADHHVHHFTYSSNFGHLFTVWDRMSGRYKSPSDVKTFSMYQSFVET